MKNRNSLVLWDQDAVPFSGFSDLHRQINRLFDGLVEPGRGSASGGGSIAPPCDIEETSSHYLLSFDMPGLGKDHVDVQVVDDRLVVSGERFEEKAEEGKNRHVNERYYGRFQRVVALPQAVDADKVEAQYKDGVLRVALPKAASAKPRKVEIKDGESGFLGKLWGRNDKTREGPPQGKAA